MGLDEATGAFVARMTEAAHPLREMTPREAREQMAQLRELYGPGPDMERVETRRIERDGVAVTARVLVPTAPAAGVIVYLHGGGWVLGSADEWDTLARTLAAKTDCVVVLPEYRLAPEHPFPAGIEDCWATLAWAAEHRSELAGGDVPLVVAGDSAGGNLAAVVARRARDRGGPDVALQVLVYPVTDADLQTGSYVDPENQLMLDRDSMIWFWDQYVPLAGRGDPDASPLQADDLSGVAPAVVVLAEHDVLRAEGEAYASRLRSAGVPVEERLFAGQMHGFVSMVNVLPGSAVGIDYLSTEIRRSLAAVSI